MKDEHDHRTKTTVFTHQKGMRAALENASAFRKEVTVYWSAKYPPRTGVPEWRAPMFMIRGMEFDPNGPEQPGRMVIVHGSRPSKPDSPQGTIAKPRAASVAVVADPTSVVAPPKCTYCNDTGTVDIEDDFGFSAGLCHHCDARHDVDATWTLSLDEGDCKWVARRGREEVAFMTYCDRHNTVARRVGGTVHDSITFEVLATVEGEYCHAMAAARAVEELRRKR